MPARSVRQNEAAPPFSGTDQHGTTWDLREHQGHWVLLYFYPKDETTGCTREACGFRDEYADLQREGIHVVGVSRDSVESHRDFAQHHHLPFSLLSDRSGQIMDAYGSRGWLGAARRQSFLIGPDGRIARRYRVLRWKRHAHQVLRDVRALKRAKTPQNPTKTMPT